MEGETILPVEAAIAAGSPAYPHVPIDEILRQIKQHDKGPRKHVIILGAGMAGLVAGYELKSLGHHVEILEASPRAGGRVWTHHFKDGSYNELGAMRVPVTHDYTHYYIDAMGLKGKLIPFINSTDQNFWDIRGIICRKPEAQAKIYPHYRLSSYIRKNAASGGAILGWLMDTLINTLTEAEQVAMFAGRADTDYLQYLSTVSLGAFLNQSAGMDAKDVVGVFTSLDVWWDKALSMFLRDEMVGTGSQLTTLDGGLDQLPKALHAKVASRVQLGLEVLSIRLADGKVELQLRDAGGGDPHPKSCDYLLCTIPFSVLRRLDLAGFTNAKMSAVRGMTYANATKVLLDCKRRFWQDEPTCIFGGSSISDRIQRQTYYPMNGLKVVAAEPQARIGAALRQRRLVSIHTAAIAAESYVSSASREANDAPGALTGAYTWDQDARRLGVLDPGLQAQVVIENLRRIHKDIDHYVVDHAAMDWETYRWNAGAFAFLRPGEIEQYFAAAIRPEGRAFFAGEHCSTDQGWIQGALIASLRAVDEIVSAP
jgi:monoamine oxidase